MPPVPFFTVPFFTNSPPPSPKRLRSVIFDGMDSAANDLPPEQVPVAPPDWPVHPEIEPCERRNLLLLATHQIVLRVGWIFKTESVVMPAFLDWLVGTGQAGLLRGCMPVLNRFGQSVPPVFCAEGLKAMRHKKRALVASVVFMGLPFAVLSAVCLTVDAQQLPCMPYLFLSLYGLFFVFNGLYHVSFGTVQGKLIRPTRRGRLLLISTAAGTIPAMLFAWWLLDDWLQQANGGNGGFGYIFGFTAVCFVLSGLMALLLLEPADDDPPTPRTRLAHAVSDTWGALRRDANLRCLVAVAMLFGSALIIFPHYQTLARDRFELSSSRSAGYLMLWVIVQNAAVGGYSLFVGPLADVWGNRLTLRTLIFGCAAAPPMAIFLSHGGEPGGLKAFWLVFVALGFTPLVLRILVNYALEICEPAEHPRYVSTVNFCLAVPFVFSPLVGWLVDKLDFDWVFLAATGLILLGGLMTFRLDEPRHRVRDDEIEAFGPGGDE